MTAQVYALAQAAKRQDWNPARPFTVPGGPPKQEWKLGKKKKIKWLMNAYSVAVIHRGIMLSDQIV